MNPVMVAYSIMLGMKERRFARRLLNRHGLVSASAITTGDAGVVREIFYNRVYARFFPFHEDAVIVDVGAHKGFFSLFADKNTGPGATILSFEPNPENYSCLAANIAANKAIKVKTFNEGLAGKTGTTDLFCDKSQNHTIIAGALPTAQERVVTVHTLTLADALRKASVARVDFLKCDCEGAEFDIFYSTPDDVLSQISVLAIEFHDLGKPTLTATALIRFLQSKGFNLEAFQYQPTARPQHLGIITLTRRDQ